MSWNVQDGYANLVDHPSHFSPGDYIFLHTHDNGDVFNFVDRAISVHEYQQRVEQHANQPYHRLVIGDTVTPVPENGVEQLTFQFRTDLIERIQNGELGRQEVTKAFVFRDQQDHYLVASTSDGEVFAIKRADGVDCFIRSETNAAHDFVPDDPIHLSESTPYYVSDIFEAFMRVHGEYAQHTDDPNSERFFVERIANDIEIGTNALESIMDLY